MISTKLQHFNTRIRYQMSNSITNLPDNPHLTDLNQFRLNLIKTISINIISSSINIITSLLIKIFKTSAFSEVNIKF